MQAHEASTIRNTKVSSATSVTEADAKLFMTLASAGIICPGLANQYSMLEHSVLAPKTSNPELAQEKSYPLNLT